MCFSFQKLLDSINKCTDSISFYQTIMKMQNSNTIGSPQILRHICSLSKTQIINDFTKTCYKILLLKLAYELIAQNKEQDTQDKQQNNQKQSRLYNRLDSLSVKSKAILKQKYCTVMQYLVGSKCQIIEQILFFTYYSSKSVLSQICENSPIIKYYFWKYVQDNNNDELETLICILINYQIIGISIKQNVYKNLKQKYCGKQKKVQKQKKKAKQIKSKQQQCSNFIFHLFNFSNDENRVNEIQQKQVQDQNQTELNDQKKQLCRQIKQIFQSANKNFRKKQSQLNFKSSTSRKSSQSSYLIKNKPNFSQTNQNYHNLHGYSTARNSYAFQQKRKNYCNLSSKKQRFNVSSFKFYKKQSPKTTSQKEQQRLMTGLNLISANLKYLFAKHDKKPILREVQKPTIADWKKKINIMQNQNNIQIVKLNEILEKQKKSLRNAQQDSDKQLQLNYKSQVSSCCFSLPENTQKCLYGQKVAPSNQNASINHRQIGIVRSAQQPHKQVFQPKHRKVRSKQFKQQYKQFIKKMEDNYSNYFDQNNYAINLQRVLTGNYRI